MLDHLECLAVDMDGYDRCVIVVFHSFKGYDGMFVLEYLYKHHREDPITIGTKIFSLKSDNLTFKDSLCFLPFPLADFPATGLTELLKGFFPHLFSTLENQDYVGPMLPAAMHEPNGLSTQKKQEFE